MQFKSFSKSEQQLSGLDLTPLVDVVFLTLLLLMVVLYFRHVKAEEQAKLPDGSLVRPPAVERERELALNFGFRRSTKGQRRDAVPTVLLNDRRVEVEAISPELERQKRALEFRSGSDGLADVTVVIRADSDVPAGLVQELVQKCRESGFARFSLQALSAVR